MILPEQQLASPSGRESSSQPTSTHQLTLSRNRMMLQTIVIQKVTCKGN